METLKKEREVLENTASKLLELALKGGAENAEICATYGQNTKISLEKQDYHLASSDDGYNFGVRVTIGQKQGFASCNTTDHKELKEVALRAVEIAGFSPENPYYGIYPTSNVPSEAPRDLWDDALYNLSLQSQKEWTKLMVAESTKDPRFRLNEGTVSISSGLFLITNSHGTHQVEKETAASWSLMGMGVEGDTITSFDYFSEVSRKAASVPERIIASTKKFQRQLLQNLKLGPSQNYKGPVVFSPRAVIEILLSPLAYHLNGRSVVEKTGKWTLNDLGKKVIESELTIRDMPWLTDRAGCSIFDREGTPTANLPLLENGRLCNFFLDQYGAKALGRPSTGNAAGGPSGVPSVSSHCLCVGGGKLPLKELLTMATGKRKEFLMVHRYSGQVDPVTGDFSGVVKGADWWSAGERAYCAKETLISGNIFDSLGKSLMAISKETQVEDSNEESPTLLIDNVSVTSG